MSKLKPGLDLVGGLKRGLKNLGLAAAYLALPLMLAAQVYDEEGRQLFSTIVTNTVTVTDGAGAMNVIVDSSALPTGAATAANQTTIIGHVDGLEGFVDGIEALLTTLAGAVSGSEMQVDVVTSALPSGAATAANQTTVIGHVDGIEGLIGTTNTNTGNTATSVGVMDDWDNAASDGASISGDVASDSADAGEPVKIGGKAFSYGTGPTAVAANDRVDGAYTRDGVKWVAPFSHTSTVREYMWTTAQTDDAVITVGAGTRIGVTGFQVTVDEAATVGVGIRCGFGTATLTTAPTDGNGADNTFLHHVGIVPGGGINSAPGLLAVGADNEDVRCTTEATTGGTGKLIVYYFTTAN